MLHNGTGVCAGRLLITKIKIEMEAKKEVKKYFNKYFKEQYFKETDDEFKSLVRILNKALRIHDVSRWRFLNEREDYKEIPQNKDFRCLFDDGTECNYSDEHPFAKIIAWKPIS